MTARSPRSRATTGRSGIAATRLPNTVSRPPALEDSSMQTLTQLAPLRQLVHGWRVAGERIAFVPTMGNLHAGHASLLAAAHQHGRRVIASVFVNPLQFGPSEDYTAYPRTPEEDAEILESQGVDALFRPSVEEMYPGGSENTA